MTFANPTDDLRRRAARAAGHCLLLGMTVLILGNYGVNFRLIVPNQPAETAHNLLAHEPLFRLALALNLVYGLSLLGLLAALDQVLKPAGRALSLFAALCRLVVALMWVTTALHTLGAIRALSDPACLPAFGAPQVQALARLQLAGSYDAYYLGLPFWGMASTACCILWLRTRAIPRALALTGLLASAWAVACAFAFLLNPRFSAVVNASWFDLPLFLFELVLGIWLLTKGLHPTATGPAA